MKKAEPEFRANRNDSAYCCGLMELGKFTQAYKADNYYEEYLYGSDWEGAKDPELAWFGVTNSKTQEEAEKSLKKMGFKVKAKWKNGDGQTLRMWVYTYKPKKKRKK